MSHNELFARLLIANGRASPADYQRLVQYYEKRGFFLNYAPPLKIYTKRDDKAKKLQKNNQTEKHEEESKQEND